MMKDGVEDKIEEIEKMLVQKGRKEDNEDKVENSGVREREKSWIKKDKLEESQS